MELGQSCPLACKHCIYKGKSGEPPDPRVMESIMASLSDGFAPQWISLSGKEPTAFPDTLVATAKKLKASNAHLILMTNGVLIDEALADRLANHIDSFDISLDGDRPAHEWMRGPGSYDRTKSAIKILLARKARRIGIISTAVNSTLPDGRRQGDSIVDLAQELSREYGGLGNLLLSISLYYGPPGDPFLLSADQISGLINCLHGLDLPALVLIPSHYSHLWKEAVVGLNFSLPEPGYDAELTMPVMDVDNLRILVPHQAVSQLALFRVANDGSVYMGCNHLSWDEKATRPYVLGNVRSTPIQEIIRRFTGPGGLESYLQAAKFAVCRDCKDWPFCQGGDKISGLYYHGKAVDPYCGKLNSLHSPIRRPS
jgi:radical SAM protein with 4Fe4S-binding SPASM domain